MITNGTSAKQAHTAEGISGRIYGSLLKGITLLMVFFGYTD
jgi:hypothetical protein